MSDAGPATQTTLHRIAVHVLARRRADVSGRIGLRATPGGFGTPSFGPPEAPEVLRVAGTTLLHEIGDDVRATPVAGATLRSLAAFAGVDLDGPLDVGHDTPPVGDADAPLAVDERDAAAIAAWFDLGWRILDRCTAGGADPTVIQLWPEHLDVAAAVAVGTGPEDRCNLGASPGDDAVPEPYLYVGPWGSARPGGDGFWNVPFGAVLRRRDLGADPLADGVAFLRAGLERLR